MNIVKSKLSFTPRASGYRKSCVKTLYSHGNMNIADTKQQIATTKNGFHITHSTPYFPLTKSFNVKTDSTSMGIKAWQIYLISVTIISFPLILFLNSQGIGSDKGLGYDIESALVTTGIIGGIALGIYYLVKRKRK